MTIAIYPGTFDPITNGHIDIIQRALRVFGQVTVAVAPNVGKNTTLFTVEERMEMIRVACGDVAGVEVDSFSGLLVRYVESQGADVIIRGLRALSDFEFEFSMALTNRRLDEDIETVFLMTSPEYSFLSSSIVKEVASFGGSVKGLVPEVVEEFLARKLGSSVR